ncbi:MAG: hypothetical protein AB1428_12645 [Bacteroidota bacterium]
MDGVSHINDIPSTWYGVAIVLVASLVLAILYRGDPRERLRSLGLSNRAILLCFLSAAALVTIQFAFLETRVSPWGGADGYFLRAINVVKFRVFGAETSPTAKFPPGYSFMLVPFILLFGESPWAFFIPNLLLLAGISCTSRQILIRLGATTPHANIAAAALLLSPNRLLSTLGPFSDVPFALLWTASFCLLLLSNSHAEKRSLAFLAGCVAGTAGLFRSQGVLYIVPLAAGIGACRGESPSSRWRRAGLLTIGALCILIPWTIRNILIWGKLVPISANGGYNLAIGNNPTDPVTWNSYCDTSAALKALAERSGGNGWNEVQMDSFFARQGIDYIAQTPGRTLVRGGLKVVRTFISDLYTFGTLESYTNARRIFTPLRNPLPTDLSGARLGQSLYSVAYHLIFILNGAAYYVLLGLTFYFMRGERRPRSPSSVVIMSLLFCVAAVVFVLFGLSRFKEPFGAAMVLYLAGKAYGREGEST